MKKDATPRLRRDTKWTDREIEKLIDLRMLDFLPVSYAIKESRVKATQQKRLLKKYGTEIGDDLRSVLDSLVDELLPLELTDEEMDERISKELHKLVPSNSFAFAMPENEDLSKIDPREFGVQEPWDVEKLLRGVNYVRVSLGLHPRDKDHSLRYLFIRDPKIRRRHGLAKAGQRSCVMQWTGVYEDIWSDLGWRECLWWRHVKHNPKAITVLGKKLRQQLDTVAAQLRAASGSNGITRELIEMAATSEEVGRWGGHVERQVRIEYLLARLVGDLDPNHDLFQPLNASGVFQRVAISQASSSLSADSLSSYVQRFSQYLAIGPGHHNELVGSLITRLLRIENDHWDSESRDPSTPARSRQLPKLPRGALTPSSDFTLIADRVAAALGINRKILSQVWANWVGIRLGHLWQRRSASKFTAFWLANILELENEAVFRAYRNWIETFHVRILRPNVTRVPHSELGVDKATYGPFQAALLDDPLLSAVLHYEVFDGRVAVARPKYDKERDMDEAIKLIVAHVFRTLSAAHPNTPKVRIEEAINASELKLLHNRVALAPGTRSQGLGGLTLHAYVAPLVTAMINDETIVITRDQAKDIYRRNKSNYLLNELEADPNRFLMRVIRGETPI